jgi:hypothetical protein
MPLSAADIAAERRCRSLAFGHCRTAALRTMDLLRHLPPRSPCFTTPFFIFTASTVLLLSPRDSQAMRAVRTGLTCLEALERDGMWVESAIDAKQRIWGLARRWGITSLSHDTSSWHHISSQQQPANSHATSHKQAEQDCKPISPTSAASISAYPSGQQNRSDSEVLPSAHDSPRNPLDFTNNIVLNHSPSNFDLFYLDSMPEQNVAIPWAAGPAEPALWLMGNTSGSSYQSSWDYLLSNPTVAQADTHSVLTPTEAEALMQELRRGNLGIGHHGK